MFCFHCSRLPLQLETNETMEAHQPVLLPSVAFEIPIEKIVRYYC